MESSPHFPALADRLPLVDATWHLAVRVAAFASLLALAVALTLTRFVGVDARVVLLATACAGWMIGCHLPVAAVDDAFDADVDALFDFDD